MEMTTWVGTVLVFAGILSGNPDMIGGGGLLIAAGGIQGIARRHKWGDKNVNGIP